MDISDDKNPSENVTLAVGGYGGTVGCLQGEVICLFPSFSPRWGYNTNFCTGIDQETIDRGLIHDIEEATGR